MGVDLKMNKTKILATIGPATDTLPKVEQMIRAGVRGFRQNMAHGSNEEREQETQWIRATARKQGVSVAIVQDLLGPKLYLGKLKHNHLVVKKGDELGLTYGIEHDGGPNLPVKHDLSRIVKPGDKILLFDGMISAEVMAVVGKIVQIKVLNSGFLMSNKSINVPDTDFGGDIFTEKDLIDIKWGASQDYDYVALSFVQTAGDVEYLRKLLRANKSQAKIIAKIETKSAIDKHHLAEIIQAADGVMVARGDMGPEVGEERVPVIQQEILELCENYGKFSIVATQMLESMVEKSHPTRAEVSDIAGAAMSGADVVMLSEETAVGKYPIEAVKVMQKTVAFTQSAKSPERLTDQLRIIDHRRDHLAIEAVDLLHSSGGVAILVETLSGRTAESVSQRRPEKPVVVVTGDQRVANQLALWYGVETFVVKNVAVKDYGLRWLKRSSLRQKKVVLINATSGKVADTVRLVGA